MVKIPFLLYLTKKIEIIIPNNTLIIYIYKIYLPTYPTNLPYQPTLPTYPTNLPYQPTLPTDPTNRPYQPNNQMMKYFVIVMTIVACGISATTVTSSANETLDISGGIQRKLVPLSKMTRFFAAKKEITTPVLNPEGSKLRSLNGMHMSPVFSVDCYNIGFDEEKSSFRWDCESLDSRYYLSNVNFLCENDNGPLKKQTISTMVYEDSCYIEFWVNKITNSSEQSNTEPESSFFAVFFAMLMFGASFSDAGLAALMFEYY